MRTGGCLALLLMMVSSLCRADDRDLDYPELSVAPRASDRLNMEAAKESDYRYTAFLPVQISGLATLIQGAIHYDALTPANSYTAMGVGAVTFLTGTLLAFTYSPYSDAQPGIKALPAGSPREKLVRERFADIAIEDAGRSMKWVKYGVSIANLATSFMLFTNRRTDYPSTASINQAVFGALAMVCSLGPFVLSHPAVKIAEEQRNFKSRIYAPIASGGLLPTPDGREVAPGAMLAWRF